MPPSAPAPTRRGVRGVRGATAISSVWETVGFKVSFRPIPQGVGLELLVGERSASGARSLPRARRAVSRGRPSCLRTGRARGGRSALRPPAPSPLRHLPRPRPAAGGQSALVILNPAKAIVRSRSGAGGGSGVSSGGKEPAARPRAVPVPTLIIGLSLREGAEASDSKTRL